jgi:hypothetical protein
MTTIRINGSAEETDLEEISYEHLAVLAFGDQAIPNAVYSATYSRGRHHGGRSMIPGEVVEITDGMSFNIGFTNNA